MTDEVRCNSGFGPHVDLIPLGPNSLADLVPLNEILADLVPPQKHLIIKAFLQKNPCFIKVGILGWQTDNKRPRKDSVLIQKKAKVKRRGDMEYDNIREVLY